MLYKDKLIKEYPLIKRVDSNFEIYEVIKRRYVVFIDEKVSKTNIEQLLNKIDNATRNGLSPKKSLIVVGRTDEEFHAKDLLFFNGEDTFIVFYLINESKNEIYYHDKRVFLFSVDWKKIVRKFNEILKVY